MATLLTPQYLYFVTVAMAIDKQLPQENTKFFIALLIDGEIICFFHNQTFSK